ncbi:endonuclease/exonuclease/phosphatase family protein [Aliikangiella sp. IMCC44359]|uniref:endonuclease/exonuclease/phosphatase family protein n=1 Tax=Aliikangiella sp. IMCC44359 TaxID=3459125 RepID=UPI00403AB16F
MLVILITITIIFLIFSLIPLSRSEYWWVRIFDFPRLQFVTGLIALLLCQITFLDLAETISWFILSLTFLMLGYQSWWIVPYTKLHPKEVKKTDKYQRTQSISLITANVLMHNRSFECLKKIILDKAPDIFVTLESDKWWEKQLDTLTNTYPYSIKCPQDNLYGMHVYSKLPLEDGKISFRVESDIPSITAIIKLPNGKKITAFFLHPAPPSPTENESSIERDVELILVAKESANHQLPVIVTGDLNDVAWSETTRLFRKLSGLLDPRVGRGLFNTFHAEYFFMRWPLDHLFHSKHFTLNRIQRLPYFGSDHFAIYTELQLTSNSSMSANNHLEAMSEDKKWAAQKLDSL